MVARALAAYLPAASAAITLDIGGTPAGQTVVVEVNDGYSLGGYGLMPLAYAKVLPTRWDEMTGSADYGDF